MALITPELYIGEIGGFVKVIRNPGRDHEVVLFGFDLSNKSNLPRSITQLEVSPSLTSFEKMRAIFWLGYFYAHQVRPNLAHDSNAFKGKTSV